MASKMQDMNIRSMSVKKVENIPKTGSQVHPQGDEENNRKGLDASSSSAHSEKGK